MRRSLALTAQQEKFAREYVRIGVAAAAYRIAYNVRAGTRPETVWSSASALLADPKVSARVATLVELAADRAVVSRARMLLEMEQNRAFAQSIGNAATAQTASRDRAKILGHLPPAISSIDAAGAAAKLVQSSLAPETRSLFEIARRIAFVLAEGRRRSSGLLARPPVNIEN